MSVFMARPSIDMNPMLANTSSVIEADCLHVELERPYGVDSLLQPFVVYLLDDLWELGGWTGQC